MMGIQFDPCLAVRDDHEDLIEIWNLSFNDSLASIKSFLKFMAQDDLTVVCHEDGRTVAAAYLIPCRLNVHGKECSAMYLYAAATHPDYRRRGYMSKIISYSKMVAEERGADFLFISPGRQELYKYCSKFGFRPCFYQKTVEMSREKLQSLQNRLISEEEKRGGEPLESGSGDVTADLAFVRRYGYKGNDFVEWDDRSLKYIFFKHHLSGGSAVLLKDGYALYKVENGTAEVKEICALLDYSGVLERLLQTEAENFVFTVPVRHLVNGQKTATGRTGMGIALTRRGKDAQMQMKDAYIGFALG